MPEHELRSTEADDGDMVKVRVNLPDDESVDAETLWAERLADGTFRLRNSPFYAYGLSFFDVVEAGKYTDGMYEFVAVARRGGHSTYRALLPEKASDTEVRLLLDPLLRIGCTYEGAWGRLICLDVPPSVNATEAFLRLERGEREGLWRFEEAHRYLGP